MPLKDKIPSFTKFIANPVHAVAYILLLYFIYKEFIHRRDCTQQVAKYEIRITKLEEERDRWVTRTMEAQFQTKSNKGETDSLYMEAVGAEAKREVEKR